MKAENDAKGRRKLVPAGEPDQHFPCDDVLVAVGQENAFPWIERDSGIEFDEWNMPKVDKMTMASTNPKVFFGGDAAFGPKNIIWAVAHGHEAAVSIDKLLNGEDITDRPLPAVELMSQKMGIHEWSYDNEIALDQRYKVPLRDKVVALKDIKAEVELGFDAKLGAGRSRPLPELRRADGVHRRSCASNAMPASTSARWTASPSPRTARKPSCAQRLNAPATQPHAKISMSRTASRPAASWSRMKTSVCIAACAPNAARPAPGTCRNSCWI